MKLLSEVLKDTLNNATTLGAEQSTLPLGLTNAAGLTITRRQPNQASLANPAKVAAQATSAALWLSSLPQPAVRITSDYALQYDPTTGTDTFAPCGVLASFDFTNLPENYRDKLVSYLGYASIGEIAFQLAKLLLHRRKGGLGEAAMPQFIEDVAGDLRRLNISSLGMALLNDHLRRERKTPWFPDWEEIEAAARAIETGIDKALCS